MLLYLNQWRCTQGYTEKKEKYILVITATIPIAFECRIYTKIIIIRNSKKPLENVVKANEQIHISFYDQEENSEEKEHF